MPLPLPHLSAVETDNNPKQTLREALAIASETSGRRLEKLRKEFPKHRAQLLDQLDLDGPLATLRSWQDLVLDVQAAVLLLREDLRQRGRQ
jgi:hypothetical protein